MLGSGSRFNQALQLRVDAELQSSDRGHREPQVMYGMYGTLGAMSRLS